MGMATLETVEMTAFVILVCVSVVSMTSLKIQNPFR